MQKPNNTVSPLLDTSDNRERSPGPLRPQAAGGRRAARRGPARPSPTETPPAGQPGPHRAQPPEPGRPPTTRRRRETPRRTPPALPSCRARGPLPGGGRQPSPACPQRRQRVRRCRRAGGNQPRLPGNLAGPPPPRAHWRETPAASGRKRGPHYLATGRPARTLPESPRAGGGCSAAP